MGPGIVLRRRIGVSQDIQTGLVGLFSARNDDGVECGANDLIFRKWCVLNRINPRFVMWAIFLAVALYIFTLALRDRS